MIITAYNIINSNLYDIFNQDGIPKMFYLYGNHDYNLEIHDFIHLAIRLKELEKIIYIGRGNSYVQLNDNDPINICHNLSYDENHIPKIDTNLKLYPLYHKYHIRGKQSTSGTYPCFDPKNHLLISFRQGSSDFHSPALYQALR